MQYKRPRRGAPQIGRMAGCVENPFGNIDSRLQPCQWAIFAARVTGRVWSSARAERRNFSKGHRLARQRAQVTLNDVAKRAGVSVATASKALNARDEVAPATRKRVLEAAE